MEPLPVEVRKFGKRSVASPDLCSVASPDLGLSHHQTKNKEENKEKERKTNKQEGECLVAYQTLEEKKTNEFMSQIFESKH
jgi:hypothetical protein